MGRRRLLDVSRQSVKLIPQGNIAGSIPALPISLMCRLSNWLARKTVNLVSSELVGSNPTRHIGIIHDGEIMAKFPDFIVIGQMKTCTTSLWYNLDNHPEITMCSQENDSETLTGTEITFWGSRNFKKGIQWYKSLFRGAVAGEKSPSYINNAKCFRQMARHIPDVKLILCVRNPVDRACSQYQMVQRRRYSSEVPGYDNVAKFSKEGKNYKLLVQRGKKVPNAPGYKDVVSLSDKGRYHKLLKNNVLPCFSRDQLHICVAEWMRRDPNTEIQKVYDFLGLEHHSLPNARLESSIAHGKGKLKAEVKRPNDYKEWHNEYPELPVSTRMQLLKLFEQDNNKLFNFLGYTIPEWSK